MAMNDKTFDEVLTFTRATPKWVWDGTGKLVEVPVDQPAYDHDPVTGEALGVLIEPSATNLAAWSDDALQWGEPTGVSFSTSVGDGVYPGTVTQVLEDTSDGTHLCYMASPASSIGDRYTFSLFIKPESGRGFRVSTNFFSGPYVHFYFDFSTLTTTISSSSDSFSSEIIPLGQGFYRVILSGVSELARGTSLTLVRFHLTSGGDISYVGSGDVGATVFGYQIETGSVATSYIPTAGAAVTRAADSMSRTLGAEFNPSAGTIFIEYESPVEGGVTYGRDGTLLFRLSGNGSGGTGEVYRNQFVAGRRLGSLDFTFRDHGGTGFDTGTGFLGPSLPYGQKNKIAVCYNSGVGFIAAVNGSTTTHAEPDLPSVNWSDMSLTTPYTSGPFHGHKSDVRYYPYAMTAAELEALTTL